jgi:hypothetical protein
MNRVVRRAAVRNLVLVALFPLAGAPPSLAADPAPLAIKGYDPVAYFTVGKAMPGLPDIHFEWDERVYRFARPEHREMFQRDPVRYAPQFANFCAMALSLGEIVEADPENWLISDGKLYIFGKPGGPALFKQDLAGNLAKATQNRALLRQQ